MSAGAQAVCAYNKCGLPFIKTTHNQKYHDEECCRLATNERIMAKYYERKARRGGAKRMCITPGCQTQLSRYNADRMCAKCQQRTDAEAKRKFLDLLS